MDAEKIERFRDRVTFISGSSKNAGKTTFLNHILPALRRGGKFAFLTIGIDGEKKDLLFGNEKPSIETEAGDYLVTTESMLESSTASFEMLHVFPWKTVLGRPVLVRTVRNGLVELAGPETNDQLRSIIEEIRKGARIGTVVVDGAVNRITQLAAGDDASYYYIMKVTPENLESTIDRIRCMAFFAAVPRWAGTPAGETLFRCDGAFTERDLKSLGKSVSAVVLEDFTRLFLSFRDLRELEKKAGLFFEKILVLEGVVVNLVNMEKSLFLEKLGPVPEGMDIIYNPYRIRGKEE